jgi:excisionase family DNA binding protein
MQQAEQIWMSLRDDPLMRLSEVAASLRVSRDTVRRWVRERKLQGVRVGGTVRIRRSGVLAFVEIEDKHA